MDDWSVKKFERNNHWLKSHLHNSISCESLSQEIRQWREELKLHKESIHLQFEKFEEKISQLRFEHESKDEVDQTEEIWEAKYREDYEYSMDCMRKALTMEIEKLVIKHRDEQEVKLKRLISTKRNVHEELDILQKYTATLRETYFQEMDYLMKVVVDADKRILDWYHAQHQMWFKQWKSSSELMSRLRMGSGAVEIQERSVERMVQSLSDKLTIESMTKSVTEVVRDSIKTQDYSKYENEELERLAKEYSEIVEKHEKSINAYTVDETKDIAAETEDDIIQRPTEIGHEVTIAEVAKDGSYITLTNNTFSEMQISAGSAWSIQQIAADKPLLTVKLDQDFTLMEKRSKTIYAKGKKPFYAGVTDSIDVEIDSWTIGEKVTTILLDNNDQEIHRREN